MRLLVLTAKLYRAFFSPALHLFFGGTMGCRFEPTCGHYSEQALSRYPTFKALRLIAARVLRCHPFSKCSGLDPLPER